MSRDLRDGLAVVTGASAGLGRALAMELAARGMRVAGLARRADALAETAALAGAGFVAVPVDVADADAVQAAFAGLAAQHGPVTVLINNAAVYPRRDILDETTASFMHSVAINLGGTLACTQAVLAGMVQTGQGRIVNVATFADVAPLPASSAYAVSKGAARVLTRALVADLGDRFPGIVISDWMPGMLATGMGIDGGLDPRVAARWGVALALWHDPTLNGTVWEMDSEVLPPRGIKGRIADRLLGRRRKARRL